MFVINETLARQAFPGADPIGKRIRLPFVDASTSFAQVVGVVADLRYSKLGAATEPELFVDYAHARIARTTLTIRTSTEAMVVRQGMAITLGGIALGLVAAIASTQVMTALLYEVTPTDLATFAAAVAIVVGTAFAACWQSRHPSSIHSSHFGASDYSSNVAFRRRMREGGACRAEARAATATARAKAGTSRRRSTSKA